MTDRLAEPAPGTVDGPDDPSAPSPSRAQRAGTAGLASAHQRLDTALRDLNARTSEIAQTGDRLRLLLETVLAVGSDLDLHAVLQTLVNGACGLVDARYGALAVLGSERNIAELVTAGLADDDRDRIGALPAGHGILGLLASDPRPLRLRDLRTHPNAVGFPPNHPPMTSLLGVPIWVRNDVYGILYLSDKHGGVEFTDADEEFAVALAAAAGVAIENARLYEDERRREGWLDALGEVSRVLLRGGPIDDALALINERSAALAHADGARIMVPDSTGEYLEIVTAWGAHADRIRGMLVPIEDTLPGEVFTSARLAAHDDAWSHPRIHRPAAEALNLGPVIFAPLKGETGQALGVISIGNVRGGRTFDQSDIRTVETFATQAAIAVEIGRARLELERLSLLEDRERIGRDLHDLVIQRLYAAGMSLQVIPRLADQDRIEERVREVIDEIDATIREIRATIFELSPRARSSQGPSLRREALVAVRNAADRGGWAPAVRFDGAVDTLGDGATAEQLLASLQEALSNAVRHSRAARVDVAIRVDGGTVSLEVHDDGIGIPETTTRRSGLATLEARAREVGGAFMVHSEPGRGTDIEWSAPLG